MIQLPAHIASRIQRQVAGEEGPSGGIHDLARGHGAIALHGTIGAIWFLRPDGSFWQCEDYGDPLMPLPAPLETGALVLGTRQHHPWLAEVLPARSKDVVECTTCGGVGYWEPGWVCGACSGLGWTR